MTDGAKFQLPLAAAELIAAHVSSYGNKSRGVETGGFLLAKRGSTEIDVVALAGTDGITRQLEQLHITGIALEALCEWADDDNRRVVAQFHSHWRSAFLSPIDRTSGFRVEGFVTSVVPDFAHPPTDSKRWGWWHFTAGEWQPIGAPEVLDGAVNVVTFDEAGIR